MEPIFIFSILGVVIVILLFVGAPLFPVRLIGQIFIKVIIGALLLFFVNAFGTSFDLHIPINLITSSISGILGLPGLAALIIIKLIIIG